MRTHRIILGLVLAIGGAQAASGEEYRGTYEQQMACTPDVWRFCGAQIPDVNGIVACLQRNMPNLSDGCRAVFQSHDSVAQQQQQGAPPPRAYGAPAQPHRMAPPPPPRGYYPAPRDYYYDDDD